MHGNVWEWTQDTYSADYYADSDADSPSDDPSDPPPGPQKVVRGGSWHSSAGGWHSSFRKPYDGDYRGISIGFRVLANVQ